MGAIWIDETEQIMSRQVAKALRAKIYARDGYRCQYCGVGLAVGDATVDHVVSERAGGDWSEANLVACCKPCNSAKRHESLEWFRRHLGLMQSAYAGIINLRTYDALIAAGAKLDPLPHVRFHFEAIDRDGGAR